MHLLVDDPEERSHRRQVCIRRLASDELDDGAAERPDVGGGGEARHLDDLGRHPVRSAHHRIGLCVEAILMLCRDAKVGELHLSAGRDEDVGALDVAVDHALIVQEVEALEHL